MEVINNIGFSYGERVKKFKTLFSEYQQGSDRDMFTILKELKEEIQALMPFYSRQLIQKRDRKRINEVMRDLKEIGLWE